MIGCVAQHKNTSIFLQSRVRNCWHATTHLMSLQSLKNTLPLTGPSIILQFTQSSIVMVAEWSNTKMLQFSHSWMTNCCPFSLPGKRPTVASLRPVSMKSLGSTWIRQKWKHQFLYAVANINWCRMFSIKPSWQLVYEHHLKRSSLQQTTPHNVCLM